MDMQISNITMPVAALLASLIGATATITATLIQLRMAWRREMKARERGQPVTKQARRGPVVAVVVLLIASAVGGFALSQYLVTGKKKDAEVLRSEFNARLDQLNAAVERIERLGRNGTRQDSAPAAEPNQNTASAVATVTLAPCHDCSEQGAGDMALCTSVPAAATVKAVELYSRDAESTEAWPLHRVEAEQDLAGGRFSGQPQERLESDTAKQVCQGYRHWNNTQARSLRLVVHYTSATMDPH